jgi:peptidoglycan hydrolase CwlO-like protein
MSLPKIQSGLEKIESQIAEAQAQTKRVEDFVRAARTETNTKFEALMQDQNSKFTNLKTELGAMRNDISSLRSEFSIKVTSMEKKISGLEASLSGLEKSLKES